MEETYLEFFKKNMGEYLHTDKNTSHNYITEYYDKLFTSLRNTPLTILEIGNYRGDFLRLCRDYLLSKCTIVGIDINPYNGFLSEEKITFYKKDAYCQETLDMFPNDYFDICIDDGSHKPEHQKYFLQNWIQKVKPGGRLILEDVENMNLASELMNSISSISHKEGRIVNLENPHYIFNIIIEIIK